MRALGRDGHLDGVGRAFTHEGPTGEILLGGLQAIVDCRMN
jgi:hypothetical protein